MPTPVDDARRRVLVRTLIVFDTFGFDRAMRLDLATTFLNRASTSSFNDLPTDELIRLRDGMECAALVAKACMDRAARR